MSDGTLKFDTKLSTDGISEGIEEIGKKGKKATDDFDKGIGKNNKSLINLKNTAKIVGGVIAGKLFKDSLTQGVEFNAQIEQYKTSFEVMTGSAEKATEIVEKLKKIGAETPFELPQLAETTQLLMNYGFTADEAIDRMNMLGDISQGNAEKMTRIATAYGQMSSAGKVQLEDIKQMIEAGFNPLQEISESTGESMGSLYKRISKGTISVNEITESMKRSTSEGGKYFQSMDKQSQTLNGRWSTLKDTFNNFLGNSLKPISDFLRDKLIPSAIDLLENFEKYKPVLDLLGIAIGTITSLLVAYNVQQLLATKNLTLWGAVCNGATAVTTALGAAFNFLVSPIGLTIIAIGSLIAIGYLLIKNWKEVSAWGKKVWASIKEAWGNAGKWFNKTVVEPVKKFFSDMWNSIKDFGINAWESIKGVWETVTTWFNDKIVTPISDLFSVIYEKFMSVVTDFKEIFRRAGVIFDELVVKPITEFSTNLFNTVKDRALAAWNSIVNIWVNVSTWFSKNVIEPVKNFFVNLWNTISSKARDGWNSVTNIWKTAKSWFSDNVTKPIKGFFSEMWESIKSTTKNAWNWILGLFSKGGRIFDGVVGSVANVFKTIVNAIIRGINAVIAIPFNKINGILNAFRNISILGVKPFDQLFGQNPLPVPQIPQLEKGGILKKGQVGFLEGKGDEAVMPLERNKYWVNAVAKEFARIQPNIVNNDRGQTINFYTPVASPDEVARRLRIDARMEMVG